METTNSFRIVPERNHCHTYCRPFVINKHIKYTATDLQSWLNKMNEINLTEFELCIISTQNFQEIGIQFYRLETEDEANNRIETAQREKREKELKKLTAARKKYEKLKKQFEPTPIIEEPTSRTITI